MTAPRTPHITASWLTPSQPAPLVNRDPVSGLPIWCVRCNQADCDGGCGGMPVTVRAVPSPARRVGDHRIRTRRQRPAIHVTQTREAS